MIVSERQYENNGVGGNFSSVFRPRFQFGLTKNHYTNSPRGTEEKKLRTQRSSYN